MKRLVAAATASIAAFAFVALTPETEAAGPIELNIGSLAPKGTPWMDLLLEMEKRIEAGSNGQINLIVRPPGVMSEVEMVRETRAGERLQGCGVTTAAIAEGGNIPQLQLIELPYLFDSNAEADHVMDTVLFAEMSPVLSRRGFYLAAWSENGWRSMAVRKKSKDGTQLPVPKSPAELAGYTMRAQESDVHLEMYKTYKVGAVQKPMTEVLTSLQSGVIDGLDNTALYIQAGGLAEPLDYFVVTRHIYQPAAIVYSQRWYDSLPNDDLKKLVASVSDLSPQGRDAIRAEEDAMIGNFPLFNVEVVELSADERKAWVDPARGMHASFAAKIEGGPALLAKINKALAEKRGK